MQNTRRARSKTTYLHCNSRVCGVWTQGLPTSAHLEFHGCDAQQFTNDAIIGTIEFNWRASRAPNWQCPERDQPSSLSCSPRAREHLHSWDRVSARSEDLVWMQIPTVHNSTGGQQNYRDCKALHMKSAKIQCCTWTAIQKRSRHGTAPYKLPASRLDGSRKRKCLDVWQRKWAIPCSAAAMRVPLRRSAMPNKWVPFCTGSCHSQATDCDNRNQDGTNAWTCCSNPRNVMWQWMLSVSKRVPRQSSSGPQATIPTTIVFELAIAQHLDRHGMAFSTTGEMLAKQHSPSQRQPWERRSCLNLGAEDGMWNACMCMNY